MRNNKQVLYSDPYYNMIQQEPIETVDLYYKFITWVETEFDLYLQEVNSGIKVYFPNGWFSIDFIKKNENDFYFEIKIESKSLKQLGKIDTQMNSLLWYFSINNKIMNF